MFSRPTAGKHNALEDLQSILIGTTPVALVVQFLRASELFTGLVAGLAPIASNPSGYSVGILFFAINLPFGVLAAARPGWHFAVKSLTAFTLVSALAYALPYALIINDFSTRLGASLFGLPARVGLLSLFRHGATLGGIGIVALRLQDQRGMKAGKTSWPLTL